MNAEQVQQAIYDRLNSVTAITDAVTGIHTKAPQAAQSEASADFPFLSLGTIAATPYDTKDDNGASALVDVHIWSRSQSALTWRAIGDDIYAALQKHDLVISGANTIACRFESAVDFEDPTDGRTWHYVLTFRVSYFLT